MMNPESLMMSLAFGGGGGKKPIGTKQIAINANGIFKEDVAEFASVEVSVDVPVEGAEILNSLLDGSITGDFYNDVVTSLHVYSFYYKDISSVSLPNCISVGDDAFNNCQNLIVANLPNVKKIGANTFSYCYALESVFAPLLESANRYAFSGCKKLKSVEFNNLTNINDYIFQQSGLTKCIAKSAKSIGNQAFVSCASLEVVDILGSASGSIGGYAFRGATNLKTLIIRTDAGVMSLSASAELGNCPNLNVYVDDTLVDAYKSATNWSTISDKIKPLSEYVES